MTVIDLNLETVRQVRAAGASAIYGDVLRSGTLHEAGIETRGQPHPQRGRRGRGRDRPAGAAAQPVPARAGPLPHLRDAVALRRAGADIVASGEAEVGVALAEAVTAGDRLDPTAAAAQREEFRARLYARPEET